MSSRVWNISREGDSTASLGSLFQGSITLRVKKFFLMLSSNYPLQLSVVVRCLFMACQEVAMVGLVMMLCVWLLSCVSP